MALNSSVAGAVGKSPHELVFGYSLALPVDHVLSHVAPNVAAESLAARVTQLTAAAREAVRDAGAYAARYANRSRRDVSFGAGERVLLSSRNVHIEGSTKLK